MGIFSGFYDKFAEWLAPDVEDEFTLPPGSEFQFQRPEKCNFTYGEFTRIEPQIVRSFSKTVYPGGNVSNEYVPNNLLVVQVVWSQGEIQSVDNVYLDDLDINSDDFGYAQEVLGSGVTIGGKKTTYHHQLNGSQVTLKINQQNYTFDGYGNAYSVLAIVYDEELMPSKPKITGSGKGKLVKNLSTSAIEYSNDAIDCYYDYCTNEYGGRMSESLFDVTQLLEERTFTTTSVTTSDTTTQPMMAFNGVLKGNRTAVQNINAMRKQMRIFMPYVKGKYKVLIERDRTVETFKIDDSNWMSDLTIDDMDSGDIISKVIIKFKDKAQNGKDAKISYPDAGTNDNVINLTLDGVNNAYEAKQYAAVIYNRSQSAKTAERSVKKEADSYHVGQIIQMDEPRLDMVDKNWLIRNKSVKDGIVTFEFIEYVESIYPWVAHPIPTYPIANVPSNRQVDAPTALSHSEVNGDYIVSWTSSYRSFAVKTVTGGVLQDEGVTENKSFNLGNLPQGSHTLLVRALNGLGYPSKWVEYTFTVSIPATPTALTVTDSYIEWQHPNLADIREFIIETTENTANDVVAYSQPPSSNGVQRLEITGIKAGNYDVSVTAKGLNNLLSTPATLTNSQIDGITPVVTPIVNDVVGGFADDPHTWTALNNFTGGLQKGGVDVNNINENNLIYLGVNDKAADSDLLDGVDSTGYVNTSLAQTITGQKNFTGGLLKNNTDVISLGDITVNSAASQALASISMEQFNANKDAGLYDDYTSAEGSIAVGYLNGLFGQFNFFAANGANIEKLKSSAIEVSGSGYALNQNPTWQDTLDGWDFHSDTIPLIVAPSSSVKIANQVLKLTTTQAFGQFFSDEFPISNGETYTISVWFSQSGTASQYLSVSFVDSSGGNITASSGGAVGWGGTGTYHYFGLTGQAGPTGWTKYEIKIGANGDASIPAGAVGCKIGMLVNYSGDWANTIVYLQDYRIEKAMGSVHIENGAITADHVESKSAFIDELTTNQVFGTNAQFTGDLSAAGGTFTGALQAATGTFSGDLSAAGGTFTGTLSAANGTFNGTVYAYNIEGDVNEYGKKNLQARTFTQGDEQIILDIMLDPDPNLDRELRVEPIRFNNSENCSFKWATHSGQTYGIESTAIIDSGFYANNDGLNLIIPKSSSSLVVSIRVEQQVSSPNSSMSTSDYVEIKTRPIKNTLGSKMAVYGSGT